jgi:hypothetical protein
MSKNHTMPVLYRICGFREFRRQLQYKAATRGGRIVVADFPIVQDMLGLRLRQSRRSARRRYLHMQLSTKQSSC